jgi:hypothetical protein
MVNLAKSFGDLGRHDHALVLEERALDFFRRVLPEDHLYTGESCAHASQFPRIYAYVVMYAC